MLLKTKLGIESFLKKFPIQPQFLLDFWSVFWLLTSFGGFNRTGLAPGSQLNQSV